MISLNVLIKTALEMHVRKKSEVGKRESTRIPLKGVVGLT